MPSTTQGPQIFKLTDYQFLSGILHSRMGHEDNFPWRVACRNVMVRFG